MTFKIRFQDTTDGIIFLIGTENFVEFDVTAVDGWSGTCRCPDGRTYEVGDSIGSSESLACINGDIVSHYGVEGTRSVKKITCSLGGNC